MVYQVSDTFLNMRLETASTLHQAPTISRTSWLRDWGPLWPSTRIQPSQTSLPWNVTWTHSPWNKFAWKDIKTKTKIYCTLCRNCRGENITFTRLHIVKYVRKIHEFLDYFHLATNNLINYNHPYIPLLFHLRTRTYYPNRHNQIPICTYLSHIIVGFNMWRQFCSILSVWVSDSVQPVR